MATSRVTRVLENVRWFGAVLGTAAYRFYWDDCFSRASALAYATLFALVPLCALSFSMFSFVGMTNEDLQATLRTVVEQVLPPLRNAQLQELQAQLLTTLEQFAINVRSLNPLSITALFLTAVALLNTIESSLNVIWRVSSSLGFVAKLTSFWAVLSLGPIFLGVSIAWTTRSEFFGAEHVGVGWVILLQYLVPTLITWAGLTLLFYKLPAARVQFKDALFGAFVGAVLFEVVKRVFAYYIGLSSTYSTVYGVMASVPLFLFWLYTAWVVVLLGAEVAYQAGAIHVTHRIQRYATDLGETGGMLGIRILVTIGRNFREGKAPPTESDIAIDSGSDPVLVRTCLDVLCGAGLISRADEVTHARSLLLPPERITVGRVFDVFRAKTADPLSESERLGDLVRALVGLARTAPLEQPVSAWTLESLLRSDDAAVPAAAPASAN